VLLLFIQSSFSSAVAPLLSNRSNQFASFAKFAVRVFNVVLLNRRTADRE